MRIITEAEFFAKLASDLLKYMVTSGPPGEKLAIKSVMGPGRSGAIASVYASHYLGAIWLPAAMKLVPQVLRPVLVIDTASQSGASLRKLASRVKAEYQLALFTEPPRVKFWYEMRERPELEVLTYGGKCGSCGFEYREFQGHIIPCPKCEVEAERRRQGKGGQFILQA